MAKTKPAPIAGVCRYCQCTEQRACVLGSDPLSGEVITCWWVLEDVCSNPDCVAQAYRDTPPPGALEGVA